MVEHIGSRELKKREATIGQNPVRLERLRVKRDKFLGMEFTQRRMRNGAGLSRPGFAVEDLPLRPKEGLAESTAAVWSPQGLLAVQYNHRGLRATGVRAYLEHFLRRHGTSGNSFAEVELRHVLDEDVLAKIMRSGQHTRLECLIDASKIPDSAASHDVALSAALDLHRKTLAHRVQVSAYLGEGKRGGSLRGIRDLVSGLLEHRGSLFSLRVTTRNEFGKVTDALDLLEQRKVVTVPDSELEISDGRRFTIRSRLRALANEIRRYADGA